MARPQSTIYNQLTAAYTSVMQTALGITVDPNIYLPSNWSIYNITGVILWVVAGGMAIFEQIFDTYIATNEAIVAGASVGNNLWIQNIVINYFQYNATTPQIIQFNTTPTTVTPYYPIINTAYRIVTQCAIVPGRRGITTVKVAKGGSTPVALTSGTGGELPALQVFLNLITDPGITIQAISQNADKLFIQATIIYNGQYSAIISGTVIAAINAYLTSIPTTGVVSPTSPVGVVKLTDLIAAIRAVPGVIDVELENVNARQDTTPIVAGQYNLISGNTWATNEYASAENGAGYVVPETQAGFTFTDTRPGVPSLLNLNFQPQ